MSGPSSGCEETLKNISSASKQIDPDALTPEGVIPLCVPEIRGNEWKYVKECLDTNWISSAGPIVGRFERMIADYVGGKHAVATVNGTTALHIALLVAGVQPDDEVLISSLTFIAPANAIRYVGAWPIFMDAEPLYCQMDAEKVVNFLNRECQWRSGALYNETTGRRVRAVLPVHILGHPCDMDPILEVARKYNLVVVGDATESLGAKSKGRMVGHLGDIGCFSFNGNKIITTGGGGMIVVDNEEWADRARYLIAQAKDDAVESIHREVGYNYRLSSIQAALGCAQMEKLDEYISAKRRIAQTYAEAFASVPGITCVQEASWASCIFWIFTVLVEEAKYGRSSRSLQKRLDLSGIQARPLWQPLHLSPAHRGRSFHCPVAERLVRDALSLPSSVGLTISDQHRVIECVSRLAGIS